MLDPSLKYHFREFSIDWQWRNRVLLEFQEDAGDVEKHREFLYKVLVIGDIGVGKTSIIKRYVHGIFSAHYKSTVRNIDEDFYREVHFCSIPPHF